MTELAQQLIEREKQASTGYLDLGRCGLIEMPDLSELGWLHTLILANDWFDRVERKWIKSQNRGDLNRFSCSPAASCFPRTLTTLILGGGSGPNWQIESTSFLEKLTSLTTLDLSDNQISDARFLEKLTSLTTLDLRSNKISDARFLEKLTSLTTLDLGSNQISDGRFLEKLTTLTTLDLSSNQINDARFFEKLTSLTTLALRSNKISDARFFEKLTTLTTLDLSYNQISDTRFLEKLTSLTTLYLRSNQISDARFLENLTSLITFDLRSNKISNARFLEKLTSLITLNLSYNQISDTRFLEKLTSLTTLNLSYNQISDARFFEKLISLTTLNLSYNEISDARFLEKLTNLSTLDLRSNKISDARFLEKLTSLSTLYLGFNEIKDARFFEKLISLTTLDLRSNKISDARFLEKLTSLTTLDLRSNKISDARFLENLTSLTTLYLRSNQISDARFLEKLTSLTTLDLRFNQISDARFLEKLTSLTSLDLSDNQISDARFLEKLTSLTSLYLRSNQISDARFLEKLKGLTTLEISNNKIEDLSPLLHLIKKGIPLVWDYLQSNKICVQDNPISNPPLEVVKAGNKAILNFFQQIEEQGGTAPLYEAKLIIVGEPDAGKTTLFKILKNPDHQVPNEEDKTTTGVKVEEGWPFSHPKLPQDIQFAANLWDFGGQEIQYMTHQFFLTARSLYVILTDDRRENANMAYWFSAADLFGRDDGGRQSPVLVALNSKNFKSASKFDFDLHRFQSDYEHLQIEERRFDFASEGGYGRIDLIQKIKDMLVALPHVGDLLPRRWPEVRKLLRERGEQVNHIDEAEFCHICTEAGIPKRDDQFYLSLYLHDLGSLLHFQNDPELRDFIILNPSWAVKAVYSVLENKKVAEAEGFFDDAFLEEIWGNDYSRPEQSNLLRLMKRDRFEVCFELPGERGRYLAPQLLPPNRPAFSWEKKGLLRFHFQYQFLPKGIVTRLHVRKHEMVAKDENGKRLAWDKGAVFEKDECRAVVEERELKDRRKIIEIEVSGPIKERLYLLKLLRDEIEAIHKKWFSKVTFERMVPCCCTGCQQREEPTFFKFSELLKYERNRERYIKCSAGDDVVDVQVSELIDGIFLKDELVELREAAGRKSGSEQHTYLHVNLDQTELKEQLKEIKEIATSTERNTVLIQSSQAVHSKKLNELLVFAKTNETEIRSLFSKIDTLSDADTLDLKRIDALLEERFGSLIEKLPTSSEIVQEWKAANFKSADQADLKWKLKFKLPFILGELEKEFAWDGKAALKELRKEITAFAKGEKTFKELFVEE